MATQIYVNLPVKDLNKTVDFFTKLGYTFNQQFTDANATCMIVSDSIFVMLLVEPYFQSFSEKDIVDTKKATEVILAVTVDSRAAVDEIAQKAVEAGGSEGKTQDHGWMYSRAIQDLDGHSWEFFYADASQIPQQ